ncbi:alpha/beta hydrolase [Actinobacillus succinogenes]|uniref:Alpha/beta hydrolase fold n=1 Tax=Actinobacillus succinogenes (strain ATCC 55618 / DSM 22257 / CCUG 43843 / 130Z) TaxID=339671 RepID=A6VMY3_ACTSZ|nr:alpha/beta fold hydrolase [Actinobacillus succinogenes]ABR74330.1 alpha/beta hydrolase fold [Actinobacillus succinogenes 130Z]PHI39247.1 alpha/beta hydrolase [Actinobacillus succinogenes]
MATKRQLNYQFQPATNHPHNPVLVFLHGLFGDMNNLGVVAKIFAEDHSILRADLRNHGRSFHADEMNYAAMATDVIRLLEDLNISDAVLIGHSMGGKTAMTAAAQRPDLIAKAVIIDIAPVDYNILHNDNAHAQEFQALFALKTANVETRQQAKNVLANYLNSEDTIQFLLKSFDAAAPQKTRFNLTALYTHYAQIMGWEKVRYTRPVLFIKGGQSDYILPQYGETILAQFPQATSFTIAGAHHWVHAEKPELVARAITRFIQSN